MLSERDKSDFRQSGSQEAVGLLDRHIHSTLRYYDSIDRFWRISVGSGVITLYGGLMINNPDIVVGGVAVTGIGLGVGIVTQAAMRRYMRRNYIE